jgi:hypothetical protein
MKLSDQQALPRRTMLAGAGTATALVAAAALLPGRQAKLAHSGRRRPGAGRPTTHSGTASRNTCSSTTGPLASDLSRSQKEATCY